MSEINVDPATIDEIVRLCDIMLDDLKSLRPIAISLTDVTGFGDFHEADWEWARQLATHNTDPT